MLQLVHADTPQTEQAVREVIEGYRKKFAQEAVLRDFVIDRSGRTSDLVVMTCDVAALAPAAP